MWLEPGCLNSSLANALVCPPTSEASLEYIPYPSLGHQRRHRQGLEKPHWGSWAAWAWAPGSCLPLLEQSGTAGAAAAFRLLGGVQHSNSCSQSLLQAKAEDQINEAYYKLNVSYEPPTGARYFIWQSQGSCFLSKRFQMQKPVHTQAWQQSDVSGMCSTCCASSAQVTHLSTACLMTSKRAETTITEVSVI